MPTRPLGARFFVEVLEECSWLQLRHGGPAISVEGEPGDDGLHLRFTGKVVTEVAGRTEEIGVVEPAIVSVLE